MDNILFRPTINLLMARLVKRLVFCSVICVIVIVNTDKPDTAADFSFVLSTNLLPCLPVFVIIILQAVMHFNSITYEIDNRYLVISSGVLWKRRRSVPFEKITNIDVRQGPFERIFGFGSIWVFTPSTGGLEPEARLIGIRDPNELKQKIIERSNQAQKTSFDEKQSTSDKQPLPGNNALTSATQQETLLVLKDIRNSLKNIEIYLANARPRKSGPGPARKQDLRAFKNSSEGKKSDDLPQM